MTKREQDTNTFGGYLYSLRKSCGYRFDDFRIALGVSKSYLNDVEGNFCKPPPYELQVKMVKLLLARQHLDEKVTKKFYQLAAEKRGELPADIGGFLLAAPEVMDEIRKNTDYKKYWEQRYCDE